VDIISCKNDFVY